MKYHTVSAIHSGQAGWVGTVTNSTGDKVYRTGRYYTSAQAAFTQAFIWAEKLKGESDENING